MEERTLTNWSLTTNEKNWKDGPLAIGDRVIYKGRSATVIGYGVDGIDIFRSRICITLDEFHRSSSIFVLPEELVKFSVDRADGRDRTAFMFFGCPNGVMKKWNGIGWDTYKVALNPEFEKTSLTDGQEAARIALNSLCESIAHQLFNADAARSQEEAQKMVEEFNTVKVLRSFIANHPEVK